MQISGRPITGLGPEVPPAEVVTVGDLNSDARGSGARKSAGKPDWSIFPLWTITNVFGEFLKLDPEPPTRYRTILESMAAWQRGDNTGLETAAAFTIKKLIVDGAAKDIYDALVLVVRVLEFGEKKYKRANWAKGMPWSVCYTSAISHLTKFMAGREIDEESGVHTMGHFLCNILFLIAYRDLYPEGDDRIIEFRPEPFALGTDTEFRAATFGSVVPQKAKHLPNCLCGACVMKGPDL